METEDKELGAMAWVLKMDDATIESGLVHDFDASLSGIGQELGAGAYSMRLETGPQPCGTQGDGFPLFAATRQPKANKPKPESSPKT